MNNYNQTSQGKPLPKTPQGWTIIPEGQPIPHHHTECLEDYTTNKTTWARPRKCHSTMTPLTATIWGSVRAYAKKTNENQTNEKPPKTITPAQNVTTPKKSKP